ncbi:MAG TPA: hypothetical protein VG077_17825 [Verrucomicrobiae bacterium]|nr:hypothetical protein [Verrucomicrobiae bacterium]
MHLTITQLLERPPTFAELQALAGQHNVQIHGNELAGDFCHPDPEQPRVTGHYAFEPNGDLRGDFTGQVMGKLAGRFALMAGNAEITITEKSFLLPEAVLKTKLSAALKDFCDRFAAAE